MPSNWTKTQHNQPKPTGPLSGVKVLDMSRILAAPSCTQILGDLGADVIKIERPAQGDDIRNWGPPFLKDMNGVETGESGYYLSTGRNKRSVCLDFSKAEGRELLLKLISECDIFVENYKVDGLKKYKLDFASLKAAYPSLIYCSVTGYGQTGPYAHLPGYDMVAQSLGGLISITGEEGRPPAKVPIAIDDIMTGMYACIGILAALRHRDLTGIGQQIDLALLDVQVAWLYNQGVNYFLDGKIPERLGTGHPNIVPYQIFETSDGMMLLGIGNDSHFERFCDFVQRRDLLVHPSFETNKARVQNRAVVNAEIATIIATNTTDFWVSEFSKLKLVCSKVNNVAEAMSDPQVLARNMITQMDHPLTGDEPVNLIASPLKLSETPVNYRHPPPTLGQHTDDVMRDILKLSEAEITALKESRII